MCVPMQCYHYTLKICMVDATKLDQSDATGLKQSILNKSKIGSIDLWKNYLAIGSPELKLVNLDSTSTLLKGNEVRKHC